MIQFQSVLFVGLLGLACVESEIATAQTVRSIDFSKHDQPITLSHEGMEVTFQPTFDGDGNVEVMTAVRAPGIQSMIVPEDIATRASHPRVVAIGKLSAGDPTPSILLGAFSGGAHCCATLRVITPFAGKLKVVELPAIDGGPEETFPKDINGDGVADIVRQDDSFRYKFSSGAGSFSPPVIYNIFKGQLVNVSADPSYRSLWASFAKETAQTCSDKSQTDRNGACIAYVAAGARMGDYAGYLSRAVGWAEKDGQLPEECKVDLVDYQCPAGQEIRFFTFETAAAWFLRENGYLD